MAVRSAMAAIISRVRLLINDTLPLGNGQIFADQDVQDVLDSTRQDLGNLMLAPRPTFVQGTINFLDYFSDYGDWEDDLVLKQFLINVVTPSTSENIVGHWVFSATTLPPVYITGKTYDVYRTAADLLERWAAKMVLRYDFSSDGQSFKPSQMAPALQNLAHTYRLKQRPGAISVTRSDLAVGSGGPDMPTTSVSPGLGPVPIDYW